MTTDFLLHVYAGEVVHQPSSNDNARHDGRQCQREPPRTNVADEETGQKGSRECNHQRDLFGNALLDQI